MMTTLIPTIRAGLLALAAALALMGCSTKPVVKGDTIEEPIFTSERLLKEDVVYQSDLISDPWQGFNRTMYRFNYHFDRYVFLPAVSAYQTVVPDFVERRIHASHADPPHELWISPMGTFSSLWSFRAKK